MKSNYIANRSDLKRASLDAAKEELNRQKQEICPACEQYIGQQVTAVLLKVLHDQYGFGKRKLKNVMEYANGLFELCRYNGEKYQATQCMEWLKDEMGIDLNDTG